MDKGNYTPNVMQALKLAQQEAARLKHGYVGTEHMLLGIVALGQGVAVKVLERSGINFAALRLEV